MLTAVLALRQRHRHCRWRSWRHWRRAERRWTRVGRAARGAREPSRSRNSLTWPVKSRRSPAEVSRSVPAAAPPCEAASKSPRAPRSAQSESPEISIEGSQGLLRRGHDRETEHALMRRHLPRCRWSRVGGRCGTVRASGRTPCGLAPGRRNGCSAARAFGIRTVSCAQLAHPRPRPESADAVSMAPPRPPATILFVDNEPDELAAFGYERELFGIPSMAADAGVTHTLRTPSPINLALRLKPIVEFMTCLKPSTLRNLVCGLSNTGMTLLCRARYSAEGVSFDDIAGFPLGHRRGSIAGGDVGWAIRGLGIISGHRSLR